jgi:prophage regulatory protein
MLVNKQDRILRMQDAVKRTALSRSTIYRMIDRGEFPPLLQISRRSVGFRESEIEQFLDNRLTVRGGH